jgi:hypothetical protein
MLKDSLLLWIALGFMCLLILAGTSMNNPTGE